MRQVPSYEHQAITCSAALAFYSQLPDQLKLAGKPKIEAVITAAAEYMQRISKGRKLTAQGVTLIYRSCLLIPATLFLYANIMYLIGEGENSSFIKGNPQIIVSVRG